MEEHTETTSNVLLIIAYLFTLRHVLGFDINNFIAMENTWQDDAEVP